MHASWPWASFRSEDLAGIQDWKWSHRKAESVGEVEVRTKGGREEGYKKASVLNTEQRDIPIFPAIQGES
jgi:hypothetical protein